VFGIGGILTSQHEKSRKGKSMYRTTQKGGVSEINWLFYPTGLKRHVVFVTMKKKFLVIKFIFVIAEHFFYLMNNFFLHSMTYFDIIINYFVLRDQLLCT
jgi:hypothetical protein